jgi:hypothetical protein
MSNFRFRGGNRGIDGRHGQRLAEAFRAIFDDLGDMVLHVAAQAGPLSGSARLSVGR